MAKKAKKTKAVKKTRMKSAAKIFGWNLTRLCKEKELSASELAAELKMNHQGMVQRWLRGKNLPTRNLDKIRKLLNIELHELFLEPVTRSRAARAKRA